MGINNLNPDLLFAEIDEDCSGTIERDEFMKYFSEHQLLSNHVRTIGLRVRLRVGLSSPFESCVSINLCMRLKLLCVDSFRCSGFTFHQ